MKGLALVLVAGLSVAAGAAQARPHSGPSLTVVRGAHSFVVRGTHFIAREQVLVTLTASEGRIKTVRTSAAGVFNADFGSIFIDPCDAFSVRAVGSRGDRALLKIPQRACSSG